MTTDEACGVCYHVRPRLILQSLVSPHKYHNLPPIEGVQAKSTLYMEQAVGRSYPASGSLNPVNRKEKKNYDK